MAKKPAAAPKAPAAAPEATAAPDTPPESSAAAPAPEQTQEQAGAGETQTEPENTGEREFVIVALLVTARTEGFRRAGRAWSRETTRVEISELADDQVEALFAEPMLEVVGVAE